MAFIVCVVSLSEGKIKIDSSFDHSSINHNLLINHNLVANVAMYVDINYIVLGDI